MKRIGVAISILLLLAAIARTQAAPATAPATQSAGSEAILKSKGLTRIGTTWLLDADIKLVETLRPMRVAAKQVNDDANKRSEMEHMIRAARDSILGWRSEIRDLDAQAAKKTNVVNHNRLVAKINVLAGQVEEAEKECDETETAMKKMPDPRDAYVTSVMDTSKVIEAAATRYDALRDDAAVKAAIDSLNAKLSYKLHLGPSANFTDALAEVRKLRKSVEEAAVTLTFEGGVPHVEVVLNGTLHVSMVMDSGAATVLLTSDEAKKLGLTPGPHDAVDKFSVADGRVVEARHTRLHTIRVAQFVVEDVDCYILPPTVKGGDLLGGTFLRNFSYRMDLAGGKVHMLQTSGKPTDARKDVAIATPAPSQPAATQPADGTVFYLSAVRNEADPLATGIMLAKGDAFDLSPNPAETWCGGGTHKNQRCDYRGYTDTPDWMVMHWAIGATNGKVTPDTTITSAEAGELKLYCADGHPADNDGAIHVSFTSHRPGAQPATPSKPVIASESKWKVLFHSDDPTMWNTDAHNNNGFAVPVSLAPSGMKYLRLSNTSHEFVIVPLTRDDLQKKVMHDKTGWEGRDYDKGSAHHLGIFNKTLDRGHKGAVDITQKPPMTGWGFGNFVGKDGDQGYVWEGTVMAKMVFDIAVTADDLTPSEKTRLLGN